MLFSKPHSNKAILLSITVAMILRIFPWPGVVPLLNPDWILITLAYWCLAAPDRIGVGRAWLIGLLTDALTGRMLGQYALSYSIVVFICVKFHMRLRQYPLSQQAAIIFVLLLLSQLLIFWTENIQGHTALSWAYWLPSWVGAALWPAFFFAMREINGTNKAY